MRISALIDIYGAILTDRKREIMEYYYDDDLSLSEIAEITGISRQGVRDSIKKSEIELRELEEKLGFSKRVSSFDDFKTDYAKRLSEVNSSLPCPNDLLGSMTDELLHYNL